MMRLPLWYSVLGFPISGEQQRIRVASDIHAGSCWQSNTTALFQFLADTAKANITDFVLNGDVFDFWLLPLHKSHPSKEEVMKNGLDQSVGFRMEWFRELLHATASSTCVVHEDNGNHDMWLDEADLVKNVHFGPHFNWNQDRALPLRSFGIDFQHGHAHTLFNSPTPDGRMPVGYFITRVVATYACASQATVSNWVAEAVNYILGTDIVNSAAVGLLSSSYFFKKLLVHIIYSAGGKNVPDNLHIPVVGVRNSFERPIANDNISNYTLAHFVEDYADTVWQFWNKLGSDTVASMILADMDGSTLDAAVASGSVDESLVVVGHTHLPEMQIVMRDHPQVAITPDVLVANAGAWVADETGKFHHTYVDIITDDIVDDYPECYTRQNGTDYRGRISWTQDGLNCTAWDTIPYVRSKAYSRAFKGQAYCRNLGDTSAPWCYTGKFEWGFCAVPDPSENCSSKAIRGPVRVELYSYPDAMPYKVAVRNPSSSSRWRFVKNHEVTRTSPETDRLQEVTEILV